MAAYQSPEVELSQVGNPFGGAAVVSGQSTLYYVAANDVDDGNLTLTQFTLDQYLESKKEAENPGNWGTSTWTLPDVRYQDKSVGTSPSTFAQPAAVDTTDGPIVFWTELPSSSPSSAWGEVCASRFDPDGQGWSSSITLTWSDGSTVLGTPTGTADKKKRGTDVAVTRFGTGANGHDWLVLATLMGNNDGIVRLLLATYNVADIDMDSDGKGNNRWPATSLVQLDLVGALSNQATPMHTAVTGLGDKLTVDWYQSDPSGSVETEDGVNLAASPTFYLAAMVEAIVADQGSAFLEGHLPVSCDPTTGAPVLPATVPPLNEGWYLPAAAPQVVRDPAGRLCLHTARPGTGITVSTYATASTPALLAGATADTYWGQGDQLALVSSQDIAATVAWNGVTTTYFLNGAAPLNPPVILSDTNTEYPVYQFLFYGTPLRVITRRYGTAQVLPGPSYTPTPYESNPSIVSLHAIMDSPFPVPAVNVPEDRKQYFGSLSYSKADTSSVTHQSALDMGYGTKGSFTTTKGVGADVQYSFLAGPGAALGHTESNTDITSTSFDAEPRAGGGGVDPNGGAVCAMTSGYDVWVVRFLDTDGTVVVDSGVTGDHQAPDTVMIVPSIGLAGSNLSFAPFTVVPGDLDTYTPDALNATMATLGWSWVNPAYGDVNYFRDAIDANAYLFRATTAADRGNFMAFSWAPPNQSNTVPVVMGQDFVENTFTLTASAYAGVSGGEEFSMFGFGVGGAYQILLGMEYTFTTSTSTTSTTQWGFTLESSTGTWGPPQSAVQGAIIRYDFRSYFLPPPNPASALASAHADYPIRSRCYWAEELARYLPATPPLGASLGGSAVDTGSGPWRVVNVVTAYETNVQGSVPYTWNDPSNTWGPPVAPS